MFDFFKVDYDGVYSDFLVHYDMGAEVRLFALVGMWLARANVAKPGMIGGSLIFVLDCELYLQF